MFKVKIKSILILEAGERLQGIAQIASIVSVGSDGTGEPALAMDRQAQVPTMLLLTPWYSLCPLLCPVFCLHPVGKLFLPVCSRVFTCNLGHPSHLP